MIARLLISSLLLFSFAGCSNDKPKSKMTKEPQKLEEVEMSIAGQKAMIEIAKTDQEKAKGLMFRDNMPDNHGMLFVYSKDQKMGYYMYNCRFPLDIAFLSEDGTITQISQMEPREVLPTRSKKKVRFALEMNKGWFEKHGVKPGDKVDLDFN